MDKIRELREKVEKDPSSKLFVPLAEEYRKAGMLDEAVKVLKDGLGRQPKHTSARAALGKIYLEQGLLDEARAEFEAVVSSIPDNLFARRKLADILRQKGETQAAIEQYRRLLKLNPLVEEAQRILEDLSKPPAPDKEVAGPAQAEEELSPEDEEFLLSLARGEGLEAEERPEHEGEALTPLAMAEEEAAPVEEVLEETEAAEVEAEAEYLDAAEAAPAEEEGLEAAWEEASPVEEVLEETVAAEVEAEAEYLDAAEAAPVEEEGLEAAPVEEVLEETEAAEVEAEAEYLDAAEAAPAEEEGLEAAWEEASPVEEVLEETEAAEVEAEAEYLDEEFEELSPVGVALEAPSEERKAQEHVRNEEYAEAIEVYEGILKRDPDNKVALQGLHELQSLMKLLGRDKEITAARLDKFLDGIMKRKNEFFGNA